MPKRTRILCALYGPTHPQSLGPQDGYTHDQDAVTCPACLALPRVVCGLWPANRKRRCDQTRTMTSREGVTCPACLAATR